LDSAVADFQDYANDMSSGTTRISDSTANAYIQAGADAAHGVNDAYNCVSGENTERAIGEMTDSINAAKDDANEKIQDNIEEERKKREVAQGEYIPIFNEVYKRNPGCYVNCYDYAIGVPGKSSFQMKKGPDYIIIDLRNHFKRQRLDAHVKQVSARYIPKDGENLIGCIPNKHYMRYDVGIGWTHITDATDNQFILKFKGDPWDYSKIRGEYAALVDGKAVWTPDHGYYYSSSFEYYVWWTTRSSTRPPCSGHFCHLHY
jgi:hypothetical protein